MDEEQLQTPPEELTFQATDGTIIHAIPIQSAPSTETQPFFSDIDLSWLDDVITSIPNNPPEPSEPVITKVIEEEVVENDDEYFDKKLTDKDVLGNIKTAIVNCGFTEHVIDSNNPDFVEIYLRFDEFTISNNVGQSHLIKGLWLKFSYNLKTRLLAEEDIYGARDTYSYMEFIKGYRHSHLEQLSFYDDDEGDNDLLGFTRFCTGEMETTLCERTYEQMYIMQYVEDFEFLLETFRHYVEWESLEGGPYMKIAYLTDSVARSERSSEVLIDKKITLFNQNGGSITATRANMNDPNIMLCAHDFGIELINKLSLVKLDFNIHDDKIELLVNLNNWIYLTELFCETTNINPTVWNFFYNITERKFYRTNSTNNDENRLDHIEDKFSFLDISKTFEEAIYDFPEDDIEEDNRGNIIWLMNYYDFIHFAKWTNTMINRILWQKQQ